MQKRKSTCSSRTLRFPLETWWVSPRIGLYGVTPKITGRTVEMLHVTTAMNLSSGLSPLLHLLIISLATQYTDSPKHWRWDFGMLKRGGNWTFQITNTLKK